MIQTDIYAALRTLASGNVFWGIAPSGSKAPFVVLNKISGHHDWTMGGATGARSHHIQVDCYAATPLAALTLSDQVFAAFSGAANPFGVGPADDLPADYDEETGLHRASIEYTLQT